MIWNQEGEPKRVRTRRVYYLAGFDPRGASFYHRLYRSESAKQGALLGAEIRTGKCLCKHPFVKSWEVTARWGDEEIRTEYEFLVWDDIVREYWPSGFWSLLKPSVWAYVSYFSEGCLARIRRISKGAYFTVMLPLYYGLLVCILTLTFVLMAVKALLCLGAAGDLASIVAFLGSVYAFWAAFCLAEKLGTLWLLRAMLFIHRCGSRGVAELDHRMDIFSQHILREGRRMPVDEILIVGHSVGAVHAVSVAARILEKTRGQGGFPRLCLLTLGQGIPFLSFMKAAKQVRRDMGRIVDDPSVCWMDASAVMDMLGFFRVDPAKVSGVKSSVSGKPGQVVVKIFKMFDPQIYAGMKWKKRRLHFQYLMSSQLPGEFDYFRITAGPWPFVLACRGGNPETGPSYSCRTRELK